MPRSVLVPVEALHTVVVGSLAEYQAKLARSRASKPQDRAMPHHKFGSMREMLGLSAPAQSMREALGL